jgi:hypothetical protein
MAFKSAVQPLCRFCGKGIKKHTHTVWFGQGRESRNDYSTSLEAKPTSREEAQRLVNQEIVSISWEYHWSRDEDDKSVKTRDHIHKVTTWDGESWDDPFFCNGDHAQRFGYASARGGRAMAAYNEAIAKRDGNG